MLKLSNYEVDNKILEYFISKNIMPSNVRAHLQPGLGLTILIPRAPALTGCQVERGLLECSRDGSVAGMVPFVRHRAGDANLRARASGSADCAYGIFKAFTLSKPEGLLGNPADIKSGIPHASGRTRIGSCNS